MKKLQLKREVVRNLTDKELKKVAGGRNTYIPVETLPTLGRCDTFTTWTHYNGGSNCE